MSSSSSSSQIGRGRQRQQQGGQSQQQGGQQGGQQGQQQFVRQQRPVFDISTMDDGFTAILFPMKIPQQVMKIRESLKDKVTEPNSRQSLNLLVATWTLLNTLLKSEPNFFLDMLRHQAIVNARRRVVPKIGGGGGGRMIVVATPPDKKDIMDELCKSDYLKNYITQLWYGIIPTDLQQVLLEIINQYKSRFDLSSFEESLTSSSSPKTLKELLTILCEIFATLFIYQTRIQKKGKQNQTQKGKTSRSGRLFGPSNTAGGGGGV
jgi:hypothetical protein